MHRAGKAHVVTMIATLNEEEGIGPTIQEVCSFLGDAEILVVDGRSVDRTIEIAKNMNAEVILQDRKGKGQAIEQGLRHLNSGVRNVVFIDGDFTYPAEFIPKMVEIMDQNSDVGMVIGNRFNDEFHFKGAINDFFYLGNRMLAYAQHVFNGAKLSDPLSGLRIVRYEALKDWKPKSEGFDIEAEMNFLVERRGYRIVEIPIGYRQRLGEKKLKLRHGFTILKRMMSESVAKLKRISDK